MSDNQADHKPKIIFAEFPRDVPAKGEEGFLSIVIHGKTLIWAWHHGYNGKFSPRTIWTTTQLDDTDLEMEPCKALFRFVHSDVCEYIFGHNHQVSATKQTALEMSIKRKVPALSVYIISAYNDPYCEQLIEHLFADIFANLRKLRNGDFFTPDMGMSESMCTESVAALYACKVDYKGPVLYINFGSAITFYALDEKEHIIGGGISAGLRARFQALHDFCDDNEPIPYIEYTSIINKAIATNKPISLFSNDTPTATVASNIAELAGLLRNIVKQFIEQVRPANNRGGDANADGSTLNNNIDGNDDGTHRVDGELLGNIPAQNDSNNKGVDITDVNMEASKDTEGQLKAGETVEKLLPVPVVITGKESLAIINLLSAEGCSKIVSLEPGVTFPPDSSRAIFHRQNHMAFHGIENLLYTLSKVADPECPNRDDGLRERIVGLRVAKGVVVVSTREGTTTTESSNRRKSKVARVAQSSDVESPTERKYTSRGTVVRVAPGETFEEDMFQIVYDGDECVGEYVDLVGLYDGLCFYADVMEKSTETNSDDGETNLDDWEQAKLQTLKGVQADMELIPMVKHRKSELEEVKANHGSIESVVRMEKNEVNSNRNFSPQRQRKRKSRVPVSQTTIPAISDLEKDPEAMLGTRVAKYFPDPKTNKIVLFFGTVESIVPNETDETSSDPIFWHVHYDDGDEEDMDIEEIRIHAELFQRGRKSN